MLSGQFDELFAALQGDWGIFSVLFQGNSLGNTKLRPAVQ